MRRSNALSLSISAAAVWLGIAHPGAAEHVAAVAKTPVPGLWGDLSPGPHPVGFTILYRFDGTRVWTPPRDDRGRAVAGERTRPVRVSVWYPAAASGRAMTYADYVRPPAPPGAFVALNDFLARRNERSLAQIIPDANVREQLARAPVGASYDARPAAGRHPLVVCASGLNETWQHPNFVLCELLASHGFTVAAVPQLGTTSSRKNLGSNPIDLETQIRDVEFAIGELRLRADVDASRLVCMGHSMGGIVALCVALRNPDVRGVVGLDASYASPSYAGLVLGSAYYRPERFRAPLLDLRRPGDGLNFDPVRRLRYADLYLRQFPGMFHGDFTSFPMIALHYRTGIQGRAPETVAPGYEMVCREALTAMRAFALGDSEARLRLRSGADLGKVGGKAVVSSFREGRPAPPTEEEFVQILVRDGLAEAIRRLHAAKSAEPDVTILGERLMTGLAYDFVDSGEPATGAAVVKLALEEHPGSADLFDSLGDLSDQGRDSTTALAAYRRVIELAPTDSALTNSQREDLLQRARERAAAAKP